MKFKLVVRGLILASATALALPAYANIAAQRNCNPSLVDLKHPQETVCTWDNSGDNAMQMAMQGAADLPMLAVECVFYPKGKDKIVDVQEHKSAQITNLTNDGYHITFNLTATDPTESANVVFTANRTEVYDPGDVLKCNFHQ